MSMLLVVIGLAVLGVGLFGAITGAVPRFNLSSRKQAAGVMMASFVLLAAGGAMADPLPQELRPSSDGASSPEPGVAPSPVASPSPIPSPAPPVLPSTDPAVVAPTRPAISPSRPSGVPAEAQEAVVARHVDGDTIWAEGGTLPAGAVSKIRVLEIDTPEPANCFGPESSAFARAELPIGSKIYLVADREDKDRYGRFLRYIWKASGEFYNEKAVRQGFAKAVLFAPNDRYIALMRAAEAEAKGARRGLWAACAAQVPAPPPVQAQAPAPPVPLPAAAGCDPSYPDFCIPPGPPDLDCADVSGRRFTVLGPDFHRFDGNFDGVGCEG